MSVLRLLRRVFQPYVADAPFVYPNSIGLTQGRILDSLRAMEPQTAQMLAEQQPDVTTVQQHLPAMVEAGLLRRYMGRMKFGSQRRCWLYIRTDVAKAYGHKR